MLVAPPKKKGVSFIIRTMEQQQRKNTLYLRIMIFTKEGVKKGQNNKQVLATM
jgi:hypothetical protein